MAKIQDYELYSFDIFDTLVTRTTFYPTGIFLLMQNELLFNKEFSDIQSFIRYNFKTLRTGVENFLKRTKLLKRVDRRLSPTEAQQEFSPEEFYSLMGEQHGLTFEQQQRLINLEIETEIKNSIPIKENIELLKELVSKGKRVVLISDMYLAENVIREILLQHDPVFKDIKIYVSSKYKEKKSTGKLYHIVAKEENINDYTKWLHIGDNKKSDVDIADKIGIKACHYEREKKTEFEENFYTIPLLSISPEAQVVLASSIQTRQFLKNNPWVDFATLATTVLYPYVKWLINKSLETGINRLYFIARDGYVLKEIADTIIEQEKIENIKTRYIYGSRQAWRFSFAQTLDEMFMVFNTYINKSSIEYIALYYDLKPEEVLKFLPNTYKKTDKILNTSEFYAIKNILRGNKEFVDLITEKNREQQDLVIKYFRQNVNFSDEKYALVDLTGSGLTGVLRGNLFKKYFGVKSIEFVNQLLRNIGNQNTVIYHYTGMSYESEVIEMFGRAPHGQTLGYEEKDGKVVPILDNSEIIKDFDKYIEAVKLHTKLLNNAINKNGLYIDELSHKFAKEIETNHTKDIAKYFSSIPFCTIGTNKKYSFEKQKLNIFDVIEIFYFKSKVPEKKVIDFALKNSSSFIKLLATFFKEHSKFNFPKIKQNFRHTSILIRNKF